MKKILPCLLFLVITQVLVAQINRCGHQHLLGKQGPQFQQLSEQAYDQARRTSNSSQNRSRQLLTVPVVVHIVYQTPEQNISDDVVQSQIDVLNEDFQRLNADAGDARAIFQEVADNPEIKFVLADTDPEGNPTSGITRTETAVPTFLPLNITQADLLDAIDSCGVDLRDPDQFLDSIFCINNKALEHAFEKLEEQDTTQIDDMKFTETGGIDAWDQDRYINIWVCNMTMIVDNLPTVGVAGYATPPIEAPNWEGIEFPENFQETDGVVIHYEAFGRNTPAVASLGFEGGRTGTHELGHYFGLRHTFGDGYCQDDDGLSDTPPTNSFFPPESIEELTTPLTCPKAKEKDTCPDDELPDMIENYMDYSPQSCQNMFTIEQVAIMRSMLEGPRSGLILEQITNTYSEKVNQSIRLFPNPTNGQVYIEMQDIDAQNFRVHVENIMGQQLIEQPATANLDLSQLDKGIYLVSFKSAEINVVKKIILE